MSHIIKDGKIYKSSYPTGKSLNINYTNHTAIKDYKKYYLDLIVAAYNFISAGNWCWTYFTGGFSIGII